MYRFYGAEQMSKAADKTESASQLITMPKHTHYSEMSCLTLLHQQVQGVNNQKCLMYLNFVQWVISTFFELNGVTDLKISYLLSFLSEIYHAVI